MNAVRVLLCDDHVVVRAGLRVILEQAPGISVVAEAAGADELIELAVRLAPDLVILDLSMPGRGGLDLLPELRRRAPGARVLVLTVHAERDFVLHALQLGAHGYLLKGATADTLLAALHLLLAGGIPIDQSLHNALGHLQTSGPSPQGHALTARESQLLQRIAAGYTNREIADALGVSLRTIERQRAHLAFKLGLQSRAELVSYAHRSRLQIDP